MYLSLTCRRVKEDKLFLIPFPYYVKFGIQKVRKQINLSFDVFHSIWEPMPYPQLQLNISYQNARPKKITKDSRNTLRM